MPKGIKADTDINPEQFDKILDQLRAPGSERVCIGSVLLNKDLFFEFGDNFSEEVFTVPEWRSLFRLLRYLHNKGFSVDKNTVINCAEKIPEVADMLTKSGGMGLLDSAMSFVDTDNFDKYLKEILKFYDNRTIIVEKRKELALLESLSLDEQTQPLDLIEKIDHMSVDIVAKVQKIDSYKIITLDEDAFLKKAEKAQEEGRTFNGIKTNQIEWDRFTGGLANGRSYVLGAPTGGCKSLFVTNLIVSAAFGLMEGDPTSKHLIIETGELMYEEDFLPRLLACMTGVSEHSISQNYWHLNEANRKAILAAIKKINTSKNIIWYQMSDFDGPSVRNLIRRIKHKEGIDAVWFDGIKINPKWKSSEQFGKIGDLSQYIKEAATNAKIPAFSTIQLTSDATMPGLRKLAMSDVHVDMFAGGRRVLQNADMGITLSRLDAEDIYNDDFKLGIGKSRFTQWHRKGEYFEVSSNLDKCQLSIGQNIMKRNNRPNGITEATNNAESIISDINSINGRKIQLPKIINTIDDIDF